MATSWAPVSADPKSKNWSNVPPPVMFILSEVNTSVVPSDLIKEYLSSSNGSNVSFVPDSTCAVSWLFEISTSKVFLIVI